MKNTTNILGISLVILIIIFVIAVIIFCLNTKDKEKEKANQELNAEQMVVLIKRAVSNLNSSETLSDNSITDEAMIRFALSYMQVLGEYSISYTDYDTVATTSLKDVEQTVEFIFGKQINYSNVTFQIDRGIISIPIFMGSTDTQIFKYRTKEYNDIQDTYVAYIDCLEPGRSNYSELKESSTTEYNQDAVNKTIIFKYREQQGRKILLSYKLVKYKMEKTK